jgi:hypothetical protein
MENKIKVTLVLEMWLSKEELDSLKKQIYTGGKSTGVIWDNGNEQQEVREELMTVNATNVYFQ